MTHRGKRGGRILLQIQLRILTPLAPLSKEDLGEGGTGGAGNFLLPLSKVPLGEGAGG